MKRIAVVGTQGVPAQYGGFESLVENLIGEFRSADVEYTVFCSAKDYSFRQERHKGAVLKYIPFFHANGIGSIPYDILSLLRCIRGFDTVLVLGVSGGIFLPVFRMLARGRLVVNIDGLEHRRAKWGSLAKKFLKTSEAMAVYCADTIIADNKGIQNYVRETYGKPSVLIAYGGDHALRSVSRKKQDLILQGMGLRRKGYALSICRIEPENNCHITLKAFVDSEIPLVFVGNWDRSCYGQQLKEKYCGLPNMVLLDSIYDLDVLFALRANACVYVHGHSAGGTNPSLVEAMFFGCPILAFDVFYNRATTFGRACYYHDSRELRAWIDLLPLDGTEMRKLAERHYRWENIVRQYEGLYLDFLPKAVTSP